jgi:transposase
MPARPPALPACQRPVHSSLRRSATPAKGRFLLTMQLRRLEAAEQDIDALDMRIAERLEPSGVQHALLMKIPGVDWLVAAVLIAEIGVV